MGLLARLRRLFRRSAPTPEPLGLPAPATPDPVFAPLVEALSALVASPDRATYETASAQLAAFAKAEGATADPTAPLGRPGFDIHGGYLTEREKSPDLSATTKWRTYGDNVRNTPILGAGVRRFIELVGSPTLKVPAFDASPEAAERAAFAEEQLRHLATPWRTVTQTACMARFNGATIQVWTARPMPDGRVGLADVAERPMHTIERWEVDADKNILGVWQRDPTTAELFFIPRERMVWSRDVPLTDSPAGVGIYRHVAEPVREWNALRKISRQGFETDLSGIPVIYAPLAELKEKIGQPAYRNGPPYTVADYQAAVTGAVGFLDNHVRTKQTGLLFDSGVQQAQGQTTSAPRYKFELAAAGGTAHEPVLAAMKDTSWGIAILVGCADLLIGGDGGGSLAMAKVKTADAYRLIAGALNAWVEVVQRDLLRPLWALNGWDPLTAPLPTWNAGEFESVVDILAGVLNPLTAAGLTLDVTNPSHLKLVNDALGRYGLGPIEAAADPGLDILPARAEAARRAGLDATPDGVIDPTAVAKRRPPIDFGEEP